MLKSWHIAPHVTGLYWKGRYCAWSATSCDRQRRPHPATGASCRWMWSPLPQPDPPQPDPPRALRVTYRHVCAVLISLCARALVFSNSTSHRASHHAGSRRLPTMLARPACATLHTNAADGGLCTISSSMCPGGKMDKESELLTKADPRGGDGRSMPQALLRSRPRPRRHPPALHLSPMSAA